MNEFNNLITKQKPLPDVIDYGLKILFVGYNPGILSYETGHHYAGKSNRFWRLLSESGLTPYKFTPEEDRKLLTLGYGSTNLVDRQTKSADEISRQEFIEGSAALGELIKAIKPRIACYVGIGVYRTFAAHFLSISPGKLKVSTGRQENSLIEGVIDYVCSNPSGLNTIPYDEQLGCMRQLKLLAESLNHDS